MRSIRVYLVLGLVLAGARESNIASAHPGEEHGTTAPRELLLATNDVYDCAFTDGGLAVAATSGGVVVEGRGVVTALDGLPDTRAIHVNVTHDAIEAETGRGWARIALSDLHVTSFERAPSAPSAPEAFEMVRGGVVRERTKSGERSCIATSEGLFVGRENREPARVGGAALASGNVAALASDGTTLFVGTFDRGLYRYDGATLTAVVDPALNPNINALRWDHDRHALWVGTARGLSRCDEKAPSRCHTVGGNAAIHTIEVTPEGDVLAGGDGSLLFASAAGSEVTSVTHKAGAPFRSVWSLAISPDGTLFVGTTSGIYWGTPAQYRSDPRSLKRVAMVEGTLPDDWVTALAFAGSTLFVGTYNAGVVSLRYADGALTRDRADPSVGYVNPNGIRILDGERLTVATMDGLFVGKLGAFSRIPTLGRDVTDVAIDPARGSFIATRRGVSRDSVPQGSKLEDP